MIDIPNNRQIKIKLDISNNNEPKVEFELKVKKNSRQGKYEVEV